MSFYGPMGSAEEFDAMLRGRKHLSQAAVSLSKKRISGNHAEPCVIPGDFRKHSFHVIYGLYELVLDTTLEIPACGEPSQTTHLDQEALEAVENIRFHGGFMEANRIQKRHSQKLARH